MVFSVSVCESFNTVLTVHISREYCLSDSIYILWRGGCHSNLFGSLDEVSPSE